LPFPRFRAGRLARGRRHPACLAEAGRHSSSIVNNCRQAGSLADCAESWFQGPRAFACTCCHGACRCCGGCRPLSCRGGAVGFDGCRAPASTPSGVDMLMLGRAPPAASRRTLLSMVTTSAGQGTLPPQALARIKPTSPHSRKPSTGRCPSHSPTQTHAQST
jgi:hypothetical protein